ncbi:MAG: hypothetical protein ACUVQP_00150 [Bacteroidales bacterium]
MPQDKNPIKEEFVQNQITKEVFRVLTYPDGRVERIPIPKEELERFDVIKKSPDTLFSPPSQTSPVDIVDIPQEDDTGVNSFIDTLSGSAAKAGANIGLGYLTSLLLSNPYTGIPVGVGIGGALAYNLYKNPKETLHELISPYSDLILHPTETLKSDPFAPISLFPFAYPSGASSALPQATKESLFNVLKDKLLRFVATPAEEQVVPNVVGRSTMTRGLEFARQKEIPLTVGQTTGQPIALAVNVTDPAMPEILAQQSKAAYAAASSLLPVNKYAIHNDLGKVSDWLIGKATKNYENGLEEIGKIRSKVFKLAEKQLPKVTAEIDGSKVVIPGVVSAPRTFEVAKEVVKDFKKLSLPILQSEMAKGSSGKYMKWFIGELEAAAENPTGNRITSINALYESRRFLDKILNKLDPHDPARFKLASLREAVKEDLDNAMKQAGVGDTWAEYNSTAEKFFSKFRTVVGESLTKKTAYQTVDDASNVIKKALSNSSMFKDLIEVVGEKEAQNALVQQTLREAFNSTTGVFDADKLIKSIATKKNLFKLVDPKIRTPLIDFAYAMKAQNRLSPKITPALTVKEAGAFLKFIGATMFARTGIQIGTFSQALGFLISHTDLAKVLADPQAAWLAARLARTDVKSANYPGRAKAFMKALSRLGVYATVGDILIGFSPNGMPDPSKVEVNSEEK